MRFAAGESDQFRFDRGAIARADRLDLSVEKGRIFQSRSQHAVHFGICFARPTLELGEGALIGEEREAVEVVFAGLYLHFIEMHRACVDAHRRTGLHAQRVDAQCGERVGEKCRSRFGATSTHHGFPSDVHQSVEEGAGRDDNGLGVKLRTPNRSYATSHAMLRDDFGNFVLPDVKVVGVFQTSTPFGDEADAVALGTRAPHRRSFRTVEHAELNGGGIRHFAHLSAECIDLTDDLSFGNAADGRIAAHLGYFVHVHRDHHSASAHACSRAGGFTTGVSGADHDDIIMKSRIHNYAKIMILWQISDRHAASRGG